MYGMIYCCTLNRAIQRLVIFLSQVRWADLEAKKHEERRKREVGFCIGGSWGQVSEEEAQAILTGAKTTDDTS